MHKYPPAKLISSRHRNPSRTSVLAAHLQLPPAAATATSAVCDDLRSILRIEGCEVFKSSVDRANLFYEARGQFGLGGGLAASLPVQLRRARLPIQCLEGC